MHSQITRCQNERVGTRTRTFGIMAIPTDTDTTNGIERGGPVGSHGQMDRTGFKGIESQTTDETLNVGQRPPWN